MSPNQSTIRFRLDPRSGLPPYRQLVEQVSNAVLIGALLPGDQLPPVREVVSQVAINPNTVQRAYRELEHLGVTDAQWGQGSFVSARAKEILESQQSPVSAALCRFIDAVTAAGMSDDEVLDAVRDALMREEARR